MTRLSILGLLAAVLLTAGCGEYEGRGKRFVPDAQGAAYELVVVADHNVWDGAPGDSLRAIFNRRFPRINHDETMFDVLRVLPSGFTKLIPRHRNIVITSIDPSLTAPTLALEREVWGRSQVVLRASAPDAASLAALIGEKSDDIMLVLETAEKDRDVADATEHTPAAVAERIREKFGFEMSTGPGYTIRSESEDFLWLSYETPASSQGIIIYTYPFSGVRDFRLENLRARRDEFVSRVPAENPGSYMTTNPDPGYIEVVYKRIEGRQWAEMLGHWDTVGDFMGGPYRNYSTHDAARQRVVAIDFYVYAPDTRYSQRRYIKQLEHFLYTVKISGEAPAWSVE